MRVLVTGGAGFIGSHIADALLSRGDEVLIVDDLSTGKERNVPKSARFEKVDIRDGAKLTSVIASFKPNAISHQAAQTSVSVSTREPIRDAEINVVGTLNLLEAASQVGVQRIVFASTGGAIYGEIPDGKKARTDWAPCPLSPYACSKFACEAYLRYYAHAKSVPFTVLRYANVYGPRQDPHGEAGVVAIFSERLIHGQPVRVNARKTVGDQGCIRDYVFVQDVVRANLTAMSQASLPDLVNIATGEPTSTHALAVALAKEVGVTPTIEPGGKREGDVEHSVLEPTVYDGLSVTPIQHGLRETVAWFRSMLK